MSDTRDTGRKIAAIRADHQQWADQQETTTACSLCGWTFTGTAYFGREAAKAHRVSEHPDLKPVRRRRGSLQRFNGGDSVYRAEGIANAAKTAAALKRLEDVA